MPIINKGVFDTGDAFYGVDISATDADTTFAYSTIGDKFLLNKTIDVVKGDVIASGNLIANGLIIRNISVSDSVLVGSTSANTIVADSVTSNVWNRLYTSNVIENTNQYFTNVRVLQAVTPVLTTANVVESSSNLYFTNARAILAEIPAVTQLAVTASGSSAFLIDSYSGDNPAIYVIAGETISFDLNVTGHPFMIRQSAGGSNYSTGLTHIATDGTESTGADALSKITGKLFWKVPYSLAGNTYVYQCSVHAGMVGNIVIQKPVSTITTSDVSEGNNLYFTNAKVVTAVTPLLTTANVVETTNQYFTNVKAIQAVTPSLTTANVVENTSLYFSNSRARAAFTAGKGIVIRGDGTIQNTGGAVNYNLDIDGTTSGNILSTMSTMLAFPSVPTTDRFLLRSIHVVNISNAPALVSGNILYATGNTAFFGNQIPVAEGGVLEFMDKPQILQPGDKINLQGFDNSGTATSNILSAMFTYETYSTDPSFIGLGQTLTTNATNYQIYNSEQSSSIVESIKFVNLATTTNAAKLYWADANGILRTHLAYNLPVPPNSSVEILAQPKRINFKDTLYASIRDSTNMSVFVSARLSATYTISENTGNVAPGGTVSTVFVTTDTEGTTLYYTIE